MSFTRTVFNRTASKLFVFLLVTAHNCQAQKKYSLSVQLKDTSNSPSFEGLKKKLPASTFKDTLSLQHELQKTIFRLQSEGYLAASIDSMHTDSNSVTAFLFLGEKYKWRPRDQCQPVGSEDNTRKPLYRSVQHVNPPRRLSKALRDFMHFFVKMTNTF